MAITIIAPAAAPCTQAADSGDGGGLRRRDVILSANQQEVNTVEELETILEGFEEAGRGSILLEVQRPGAPPRFIAVRLR